MTTRNSQSTALLASREIPKSGSRDADETATTTGCRVTLLTGGGDRPYALGMVGALVAEGIAVDFVGSDELESPELHEDPLVKFLNLRGDQSTDVALSVKVTRILAYYLKLISYALTSQSRIFHILWNNKFEYFDRTLLMLFYRILGKRITLTVHNVNILQRDGRDSLMNRWTLRVQYHLAAHLFVHTEQMKAALKNEFSVDSDRVSVIPFGINSTVENTELTPEEARENLGLGKRDKVVLFFGNVAPYKGLGDLIAAMKTLVDDDEDYRLLVAGRPKCGDDYLRGIEEEFRDESFREAVVSRLEYVPDEETEMYFKAADVLVLPYKYIFQSGVLFLGYNFGLPVIGTDVGSLKEDIVEGETGFVCEPENPADLARKIEFYFQSSLYHELETSRNRIREFATQRYSWERVGVIVRDVYEALPGAVCRV